jgi:hypothetical protein
MHQKLRQMLKEKYKGAEHTKEWHRVVVDKSRQEQTRADKSRQEQKRGDRAYKSRQKHTGAYKGMALGSLSSAR